MLGSDYVWLPAERPDMEDGEKGHLNAQKQCRDPHFDVRSLDMLGGLDGSSAGEEGDGNGLPKTQKDDQFDRRDFQKRLVRSNVVLDLNVELNQAVHSH